MTSGAIHATVPIKDMLVDLPLYSRQVPKSEIFKVLLSVAMRMLGDYRDNVIQ